MLPKEIEDLLSLIPEEYQMVVRPIFLFYEGKIEKLEAQIKELQDQISKNSRNSSKPPSTDEFKPSPKSQRKKSVRQAGGQQGHQGHNLKMVESPDEEKRHTVEFCACCQKDLRQQAVEAVQSRQVYDLPPLELRITEHQAEVKRCSCGHINKADFPSGVDHYVQYGPNIKSLLVYMQDYQLLPYERTKEFVHDIFGHQLSTGTLYNIGQYAFDQLATFEDRLKALLRVAVVAGFDETGIRIMAQRLWLHSCSTADHVYYEVHAKRGQKAMDDIGILPHFTGTAIHDFWKSYYHYTCAHGLCNAHLLRDLIFIKERFEQQWPEEFIDLLLKMKVAKERAIAQGKSSLSQATLIRYRQLYDTILQKGLKANPFKPPPKKKRGRIKKTKPRNLIERFRDYADDILRFFYDFKVPFDNNFSERDIRMMKVKQKISGCFRSWNGAKFFTRIRSFIATARKQNVNVFKALRNLFMDNSIAFQLTTIQRC
ncbi:MAG: IS66 family transposase [Bacteroidetes bacterium]|nr:IS66 family transposase [Bacteroidota bacterium]MCB0851086.1 IS66 family transposase [Bacteroidota bacterium]